MFSRIALFVCLLVSSVAFATLAEKKSDRQPDAATSATPPSLVSHASRNYPGGRDEEDLKVQETLVTPTAKIDRRTIESKVLKINSKKVDTDEPEATEQ